MVLGRLFTHVIFFVCISGWITALRFLHMKVILGENLILIGQVNLMLALLRFRFKNLLVLVLDGLLDFLGLQHSRPCISKVTPFQLFASALGVSLSHGEVLSVDFNVGRRALLLIAVLCCIWLHHHALASTHVQWTCLHHRLLLLGNGCSWYSSRYHRRHRLLF